ncbi:MAG: hypothetical protein ACREL9_08470 [Gemmatimonadales bacterium]
MIPTRLAASPALALAFALLGARPAASQDPRLGRLDPETRAAVAGLLDSARAAGLPTEPLVDRALEGALKRAPAVAIVAAVRRLGVDLRTARDALGSAASPAELDAGAGALRADVQPDDLTRLRRARPGRSLTIPLAVLADLVAQGVAVDSAAAFVVALADFADDEFLAFRRNVERDIALGAPPTAAAAVRVSAGLLETFGQQPPTTRRKP